MKASTRSRPAGGRKKRTTDLCDPWVITNYVKHVTEGVDMYVIMYLVIHRTEKSLEQTGRTQAKKITHKCIVSSFLKLQLRSQNIQIYYFAILSMLV